jgi:hypothetical protein
MNKAIVSARINTKSNFYNLNGKFVEVFEMKGQRVTCIISIDGRELRVDFTLSEISDFSYNIQ